MLHRPSQPGTPETAFSLSKSQLIQLAPSASLHRVLSCISQRLKGEEKLHLPDSFAARVKNIKWDLTIRCPIRDLGNKGYLSTHSKDTNMWRSKDRLGIPASTWHWDRAVWSWGPTFSLTTMVIVTWSWAHLLLWGPPAACSPPPTHPPPPSTATNFETN